MEGAHQMVTMELVIICFFVSSVAVGITVWVQSTFQTKEQAKNFEERIDQGITTLWNKLNTTEANITQVAVDVSFVRGHVEATLAHKQDRRP